MATTRGPVGSYPLRSIPDRSWPGWRASVVGIVALHLVSRATALTLAVRAVGLRLVARATGLTLRPGGGR